MPHPEHLIVLMLENRSFDHMLGFLPHPDSTFRGVRDGAGIRDDAWNTLPSGERIGASPAAAKFVAADPDHSHEGVLFQLTGTRGDCRAPITNAGFAASFEEVARRGHLPARTGAEIMLCQPHGSIPVLSTLALEFAVCDQWFCSVPGQTWPNRNFAVAGTSDGQVNIKKRPYSNATIFDRIEPDHGADSWAVYHDGVAQLLAFPGLWRPGRRGRFRPVKDLFTAIANDQLPRLAWVEPDHFGRDSNSQHPNNNTFKWFRRNPGRDFDAAERLILDIYLALLRNPAVFDRTLLVITYDEHGGFFDHERPPRDVRFKVAPDDFFHGGACPFEFDLLGPRVPAVLVSPFIPRHRVDSTVYEHSSIAATARALFAPHATPLSPRERQAATFHGNLTLQVARRADLPTFEGAALPPLVRTDADLVEMPASELDTFQQSLLDVASEVATALREEARGAPSADAFALWWEPEKPAVERFRTVSQADSYQRYVVELLRKAPGGRDAPGGAPPHRR